MLPAGPKERFLRFTMWQSLANFISRLSCFLVRRWLVRLCEVVWRVEGLAWGPGLHQPVGWRAAHVPAAEN